MKNSLKTLSLVAFVLAVPALIVVDWFYPGYGVGVMFLLATVGLICDQLLRRGFPDRPISSLANYRTNKLLNLAALVLFVQSPMALIYGNRAAEKLGFWLMVVMIILGIILNQVANLRFAYQVEKGENV